MADRLPETFRLQDGCWNCHHAEETWEHDEGVTLYCSLNAPPRPRCGSVAMGEQFEGDWDSPLYGQEMDAWDEWREGRRAEEYGICAGYEKETENDSREDAKRVVEQALGVMDVAESRRIMAECRRIANNALYFRSGPEYRYSLREICQALGMDEDLVGAKFIEDETRDGSEESEVGS